MGSYLELPLQTRANLRTSAVKGHSAFPKALELLESPPSDCLVLYQ